MTTTDIVALLSSTKLVKIERALPYAVYLFDVGAAVKNVADKGQDCNN